MWKRWGQGKRKESRLLSKGYAGWFERKQREVLGGCQD